MEAKVDIRKLQLLNDRINQTIDALNQVRLSVHGLSHSAGQVPGFGVGVPFGGAFAGYPGAGFGPQAFGQQGFGQQGFGPQFGGQGLGWGGMSHTAGIPGYGSQVGPWGLGGQNVYGQNVHGQNPLSQLLGVNPFGQTGISHTSPELQQDPSRALYAQWLLQQQIQQQVDPYYGMRIAQTFPFAQLG